MDEEIIDFLNKEKTYKIEKIQVDDQNYQNDQNNYNIIWGIKNPLDVKLLFYIEIDLKSDRGRFVLEVKNKKHIIYEKCIDSCLARIMDLEKSIVKCWDDRRFTIPSYIIHWFHDIIPDIHETIYMAEIKSIDLRKKIELEKRRLTMIAECSDCKEPLEFDDPFFIYKQGDGNDNDNNEWIRFRNKDENLNNKIVKCLLCV
jgi:hypothetical protein